MAKPNVTEFKINGFNILGKGAGGQGVNELPLLIEDIKKQFYYVADDYEYMGADRDIEKIRNDIKSIIKELDPSTLVDILKQGFTRPGSKFLAPRLPRTKERMKKADDAWIGLVTDVWNAGVFDNVNLANVLLYSDKHRLSRFVDRYGMSEALPFIRLLKLSHDSDTESFQRSIKASKLSEGDKIKLIYFAGHEAGFVESAMEGSNDAIERYFHDTGFMAPPDEMKVHIASGTVFGGQSILDRMLTSNLNYAGVAGYLEALEKSYTPTVVKRVLAEKDDQGLPLLERLIKEDRIEPAISFLTNIKDEYKGDVLFALNEHAETIFSDGSKIPVLSRILISAAGKDKQKAAQSLLVKLKNGDDYVIASLLAGDHETFNTVFELINNIAKKEGNRAELLLFRNKEFVPFLFEQMKGYIRWDESITLYIEALVKQDPTFKLLKDVFSAKDKLGNFLFDTLKAPEVLELLDFMNKADPKGGAFTAIIDIRNSEGRSWLSHAFNELGTVGNQAKFLSDVLQKNKVTDSSVLNDVVNSFAGEIISDPNKFWTSDVKALGTLKGLSALSDVTRRNIFLAKDGNGHSAIWAQDPKKARQLYQTLWPTDGPDSLVATLLIDALNQSSEKKVDANRVESVLTKLSKIVGKNFTPRSLLSMTDSTRTPFILKIYQQPPEVSASILKALKNNKVSGVDFLNTLLLKNRNDEFWLAQLSQDQKQEFIESIRNYDMFSTRDLSDKSPVRLNSYFNLIRAMKFSAEQNAQLLGSNPEDGRSLIFFIKEAASSDGSSSNALSKILKRVGELPLTSAAYKKILKASDKFGDSALRDAINHGNFVFVNTFFERLNNKNLSHEDLYELLSERNTNAPSILGAALKVHQYTILNSLIEFIAKLDLPEEQVKELLLGKGASSHSVLNYAVRVEDRRVVDYYLKAFQKASELSPKVKFEVLDSIKSKSSSSLSQALKNGYSDLAREIAKYLGDSGLDLDQRFDLLIKKDSDGFCALDLAMKKRYPRAFDAILDSILKQGFSEEQTVKLLRNSGEEFSSVLHTAIFNMQGEYVDALLKALSTSTLSADARFKIICTETDSGILSPFYLADERAVRLIPSLVKWLPGLKLTAEQNFKLLQGAPMGKESLLNKARSPVVKPLVDVLPNLELSPEQKADILRGGAQEPRSAMEMALEQVDPTKFNALLKGVESLADPLLWSRATDRILGINSRLPLLVAFAQEMTTVDALNFVWGQLFTSPELLIAALKAKGPEGRSAFAEALHAANDNFIELGFNHFHHHELLGQSLDSILTADSVGLKKELLGAVSRGDETVISKYLVGLTKSGLPEETVIDLIRSEDAGGKSSIEHAIKKGNLKVINVFVSVLKESETVSSKLTESVLDGIDLDQYIQNATSGEVKKSLEILKGYAGNDSSLEGLFGKSTVSHTTSVEAVIKLDPGFEADTSVLKEHWNTEVQKLIEGNKLQGWSAKLNSEDIDGGVKVTFVNSDGNENKVIEVKDAAAVKVFKEVNDIYADAYKAKAVVSEEVVKLASLIGNKNVDSTHGFSDDIQDSFMKKFTAKNSLDLQRSSDVFRQIINGLSDPLHADFTVHPVDAEHGVRIAHGR